MEIKSEGIENFEEAIQEERALIYSDMLFKLGPNITQLEINSFLISEIASRRVENRTLATTLTKILHGIDLETKLEELVQSANPPPGETL